MRPIRSFAFAWAVCATAAASAPGCGASPHVVSAISPAQSGTRQENVEFTVRVGEAARFEGPTLALRVERVESDSRCPVNVTCVWAGDAIARVELTGSSRTVAALHVNDDRERHAVFEGRRISFVRLLPAAREGAPIAQSEYEVTLLVSRAP